MNETEFRQELKNGLAGTYFMYGEEEYLKKFYIGRAKSQTVGDDADAASWNTYRVEGKKSKREPAATDALEEAVNSVPMMGEKIFVRYNADFSVFAEEEVSELVRVLGDVDGEAAVVIVTPTGDSFDPGRPEKGRPSALYKKLSAVCKMVEMQKMTPSELKKWMARRLSREKIAISPAGADALMVRSGSSMFALSGELDKLASYAAANGMETIDETTVKTVCCANEEEEAFAMANAIMNGDRRMALKALHRCKTARQEPIAVLGSVSKSLCEMLTVCSLMADGADKKEIAAKTKMHEYRVGIIMNAVRSTEPAKLCAALDRCRDADLKMKGAVPGYTALERFICTIPAKSRR